MLQVTVKSTDEDLATTGTLKAFVLGSSATSTVQDALLSTLVRAASKRVASYIGQPLTVQTYRETLAGYGRRSLMLSRTPIRGIKAIYDSTDTGSATELLTSEYRVEDEEAGLLSRDQGFGWTASLQARGSGFAMFSDAIPLDPAPQPGQEYRPWMVDYVAGWTYAGLSTSSPNWTTNGSSDTGRTLPEDVETGAVHWANELSQADQGNVSAEKLGDLEVQYRRLGASSDGSGAMLTAARDWLEPYRRFA